MKIKTIAFASDGVVPTTGMYLLLDVPTILPPGHYRLHNVILDEIDFEYTDLAFERSRTVKPQPDGAASVECIRVRQLIIPDREEATPLEQIRPDDEFAPYERMYRLLEKLYGGKTDADLDAARSANYDALMADEEDEDVGMVVSRFGLLDEQLKTVEDLQLVDEPAQPEPEPTPEPQLADPPAEPAA